MAHLSPESGDMEILAAFKKPECKTEAFTQLVKKYQRRLYKHIRSLVIVHEDTDDILQNVFMRIWCNLDNFRSESALFTWLYRIATNESLSWLKKEQKRRHLSLENDEAYRSHLLQEQIGFDASRIEWKLQQALQSLPPKQRAVFLLRYYEEMPYDQMAEVLETSVGALKASYFHAVKKIEEFLKSK